MEAGAWRQNYVLQLLTPTVRFRPRQSHDRTAWGRGPNEFIACTALIKNRLARVPIVAVLLPWLCQDEEPGKPRTRGQRLRKQRLASST